jgi:hypothetical protein
VILIGFPLFNGDENVLLFNLISEVGIKEWLTRSHKKEWSVPFQVHVQKDNTNIFENVVGETHSYVGLPSRRISNIGCCCEIKLAQYPIYPNEFFTMTLEMVTEFFFILNGSDVVSEPTQTKRHTVHTPHA